MAAETTSDALVPVNLALFKLKLMSYYDAYQEVSLDLTVFLHKCNCTM